VTRDRSAYMREWYRRLSPEARERKLQQHRDYYARHREKILAAASAKMKGRHPKRTHRRGVTYREYMRQWWANLKATDPVRYEHYMQRSNKRRAVAGLPEEIHEMRLTLFEFRSRIQRSA